MKWIKIILLCCVISIISCRKIDITPIPQPKPETDIFKISNVDVVDGQTIGFNLNRDGKYTLTIQDSITSQVISRERILGKIGINNTKIYTKTFQSKYLYLLLRDSTGNQLGKTTLIIK